MHRFSWIAAFAASVSALVPHFADAASNVESAYVNRGFQVSTTDGKYLLRLENRLQFRFADPFDRDPRTQAQIETQQSSFMVRRARFKLNGHVGYPWLKFNLQYDWSQPVLRDFYLDLGSSPAARLRVGRAKVIWNDERVTSSGRQQFVNRSILNDLFTVDRQQGVQLLGRVFPDSLHDLSYALGMFSGVGIGERDNDDSRLMYTARLQWNVFGGEIPFSQSDVLFTPDPNLNLAVAVATNGTRCTAFETDQVSCRQLPGFTATPSAGQYRIDQYVTEARFRWSGLSAHNEMHWKHVSDTRLWGLNSQLGYFPHGIISAVPPELEVALRFASVDADVGRDQDGSTEAAAVVNWFEDGHGNKVSAEIARLTLFSGQSEATRLRLQWDISF